MDIAVCLRITPEGEPGAFDKCAYEAALEIPNAKITLLSMGAPSAKESLLRLTRLGAERAVLLCDPAFAGADTLATAYTLSLALKKLSPRLILCGARSLVGDTGQVGAMTAAAAGYSFVGGVMKILSVDEDFLYCETRQGEKKIPLPALAAVERINTLRAPSIFSKIGQITTLDAGDLGADPEKIGLAGSPTRVVKIFENRDGRRSCKFIKPEEFFEIYNQALKKAPNDKPARRTGELARVFATPAAEKIASSVSSDVKVVNPKTADEAAELIKKESPNAFLFGDSREEKDMAAALAAKRSLGLCADCTSLETDGERLFMFRPALAGSVVAEIYSRTVPALATVRTSESGQNAAVCVGFGAKESISQLKVFAESIGAELCASRRAVDCDLSPYSAQVGLTGRTVCPKVYIAVGISGAVHHVVGMSRSGTVIAVNPDRSASVFDYADYGIACSVEEFLARIEF